MDFKENRSCTQKQIPLILRHKTQTYAFCSILRLRITSTVYGRFFDWFAPNNYTCSLYTKLLHSNSCKPFNLGENETLVRFHVLLRLYLVTMIMQPK